MNRTTVMLLALAASAAGLFLVQKGAGPLRVGGPAGTVASSAVRSNDEGLRLLQSGQHDGAIERFRAALSEDPGNGVLRQNLSLALSRKAGEGGGSGGGGAQEKLLAEAFELWPDNPEALDQMSAARFREGRYREALDLAKRLDGLYPDRPGLDGYILRLEEFLEEEKGMVKESGQFFRLQYGGERRLEFEGELIAVFQDQMDELASYLGVFPKEPIDILLLTEELGEAAVPLDPSINGLYDGRIRLYMGKGLPPRDELVRTARHELVHALLHKAGRVPAWFHEGVAQALGEEPSPSRLRGLEEGLRQAMREGYVLETESLEDTFLPLPVRERSMAYAASLLYVRYLSDLYGRNLVPVLVASMQGGSPFTDALRSATGKDPRKLQDEFVHHLTRGS